MGVLDRFLWLSTGDRSFRNLGGVLERCFLLTGGDLVRSRLSRLEGGDRDLFRENFRAGDSRSLRSRCGDDDLDFFREAFTGGDD